MDANCQHLTRKVKNMLTKIIKLCQESILWLLKKISEKNEQNSKRAKNKDFLSN